MRNIDLRLIFPMRASGPAGRRLLLGAAILAVLLGSFWACGVFAAHTALEQGPRGPALFFSVIIAYVVPIFGYISERTATAIDDLRQILDAEPAEVDGWRDRVHRKPARWLLVVLAIGCGSGIAHNVLLFLTVDNLSVAGLHATDVALVVGTLLTWLVVTLVVAGLIDNARVLQQAANRCRVTLLDTRPLRPFATVAVISTLALIGAQAAFPIMNIVGDSGAAELLPGLLATGIPMLLIAALPVWPVHRRISAAKAQALAAVNAELAALPAPDPGQPATLAAMAPLLAYRRELLQVSEWPFDIGVFTRLGLYLIIPPLTWIGAALIEHLVDAFL